MFYTYSPLRGTALNIKSLIESKVSTEEVVESILKGSSSILEGTEEDQKSYDAICALLRMHGLGATWKKSDKGFSISVKDKTILRTTRRYKS